jgi:hypothetical protein
MKTELTEIQLDFQIDILINLPAKELARVIYSLSGQELLALRREAQALLERQKTILALVDSRLETV